MTDKACAKFELLDRNHRRATVCERHAKINSGCHIHVRSLISPAAGNLRSQSALLGTRFRILHLEIITQNGMIS